MDKRFLGSMLCSVMALSATAQVSSTLSPYSQYALGSLAEQSQGFNRGMGGIGIGMRGDKIVNMLNPASYSAVDSLTMLLDVGVSGQITNFKEGGKRINAKTGTFDYAVASFRLLKHVGLAVGVMPFSNIGYNYSHEQKVSNSRLTSTELHDGDGGFSQVFLGAGWEFMKGWSAGFNFSYFWGKWNRGILTTTTDSYDNTLDKSYILSVSSYKLDFGMQYQQQLSKNDLLTVGATYSLGHKLKGQANMTTSTTDLQTSKVFSSNDSVPDALSLPHSFGVGVSLTHRKSLTLGIDYTFQKWGSLDFPTFQAGSKRYLPTSGVLKDRHKVAAGLDWVPNPEGRKSLLQHIHYRFGASYATPYYNIGTSKGPGELTVSGGFGIPFSRSMLNISGQWIRTSASNFITENGFRLSIGLTFNERWFAKWKVD